MTADRDLEALVVATAGPLRAYIAACGVRPGEVDDVAQDTYLGYLKDRPPAGVEPIRWLKGIARHRCLQHFRKRGRSDGPLEHLLELLEATPSELEAAGDDQRLAALRHCLDELPATQRQFALRYYAADATGGGVGRADEQGRSPAAIHMAMMRLRDGLRRCIGLRLAQGDGGRS